ncbi:MAG: type II secretion system protein [Sedimentisphaeraceae bacterium JB056]
MKLNVVRKRVRFNSRGFTLIELLVVISIIAVLMSIMMPALTKAREQAKMIVCRSNLKQLNMAANLWAQDHDDWAIGEYWDRIGYDSSLHPYTDSSSGRNGDTVKEKDLYVCPSAKGHCFYDGQNAGYENRENLCTYGANAYMILALGASPGEYSTELDGVATTNQSFHKKYHGVTRISKIRKPSSTVYFTDHELTTVAAYKFDPTAKKRDELHLQGSWKLVGYRWHDIKSGDDFGFGQIGWVDGSVSKEPDDFSEYDQNNRALWIDYFFDKTF